MSVEILIWPALIAYIPIGQWLLRVFLRQMQGRAWTPPLCILYAGVLALLYTPGCHELHIAMAIPFLCRLPAWLALCASSFWGGLL